MNKTQKFLFSEGDDGTKFVIHTREPLCIFYLDKIDNEFKILNPQNEDRNFEKMQGLTKRVKDWYVFTIIKNK